MNLTAYDPCAPGPFPVDTRTHHATDPARDRRFPYDIWYPAATGTYPLIIYSHHAGGHRGVATFLCTYLASHGYLVAAMDHSEVLAPELAQPGQETAADRDHRMAAVVAARVPDLQFLLAHLRAPTTPLPTGVRVDPARIGLVGHSFGGWTVLATPDVEPDIRAVVAMSPGGTGHHPPGFPPMALDFAWTRDVPTLYLGAEFDVPIPPSDVYELFDRTPATKRIFILGRADHSHFLDNVEQRHEAFRAMDFPAEMAWLPAGMRPITELCPGTHTHAAARGLTLAHLDATLRGLDAAQRFLSGDIPADFAARGIEIHTDSRV